MSIFRNLVAVLPALLLLVAIPQALAQTQPVSALDVQHRVEQFLDRHVQGLPGKASYRITPPDPRLNLPSCPAQEAFLPSGAQAWGKTTIGVRCLTEAAWTIYVQADIRVSADYYVSAHPLQRGQTLAHSDIALRRGDLGSLPQGVITDPAQAVGYQIQNSLGAGQPLRSTQLRLPYAVRQGQDVRLQIKGAGFTVSAEGRALGNAQPGEVVQVRTGNGQTLSGIARSDGTVEINP